MDYNNNPNKSLSPTSWNCFLSCKVWAWKCWPGEDERYVMYSTWPDRTLWCWSDGQTGAGVPEQEVSSSVFRSLMPTPALESPAPFLFISMAEARLENLRHSLPLLLVSTLELPYPAHSLTLLLVCNGWNRAARGRQPIFPNPEKLWQT